MEGVADEVNIFSEILATPSGMALFALLGACWGSFAATLSDRWPKGGSIVGPRSACASCGRKLAVADLVPILSFLVTRGRCRHCEARIPVRYPLTETACAGVAMAAALLLPGPQAVWIALFGWQLVALALLDAEHFWLPDVLTGMLAATGLAHALIMAAPVLSDALAGGVSGFLSLYAIAVVYRHVRHKAGLGGGDPKLFGAVGLWSGWQPLPVILFSSALIGIGLAAVLTIRDRGDRQFLSRRLPFGTCLAISAWLWLLVLTRNDTITLGILATSQH